MTTSSKIEYIGADVWSALRNDPATSGSVRRRVLPELAHDIFIGEHRPGHERFLWLDIKEPPVGLPPKRPSSRGLSVELDDSFAELTRIRLTASSARAEPLFTELAENVVSVLARDPGKGAAARVLGRVIAWQEFFALERNEFSADQAAGLFAELLILEQNIVPDHGALAGIDAWHGPDPALQDFQFGEVAIEVKSSRATGLGALRISSERQLDPDPAGQLYVAYVRLDQRATGAGTTLSEKIAELRELLADDYAAITLLEQRLLSYGWHEGVAQHRTEKYVVLSSEFFEVRDEFPRIVPSQLQAGVHDVHYTVDRAALDDFVVPWDDIRDRVSQDSG